MTIEHDQIRALKAQIHSVTQLSRRLGYILRDLDQEINMLDRQVALLSHPAGKRRTSNDVKGEVYEGLTAVLPFEPPNQKDN